MDNAKNHFLCSVKTKFQDIQKRTLRVSYNDYTMSCEQLMKRAGQTSIRLIDRKFFVSRFIRL